MAIRVNRKPVAIERTAGGALAVVLDDGDTLIADTVVAGIGIEPADQLAREAGLAVERGIVVNERLETSARGIYAAGDVAVFPSALSAGRFGRKPGTAPRPRHASPRATCSAPTSRIARHRGSGRINTTRSCRWPVSRRLASDRSRACSATTRKSIFISTPERGSSLQAVSAARRGSSDMRVARMLVERGIDVARLSRIRGEAEVAGLGRG